MIFNRLSDQVHVSFLGKCAYTWDWANRLTEVDVNSVDTEYTYLADGSRESMTTGAVTTDYLTERTSGLTQVVDDGSSAYLHDVTGNTVSIDSTDAATCPQADALCSTTIPD